MIGMRPCQLTGNPQDCRPTSVADECGMNGRGARPRTKTGMIDLYTWGTPNGHKIHIMLEETGLPYRIHKVDLGAGQQFSPEYLKINPNSKIPAIIDQDGPDGEPITVFESGAVLFYLAEKTGKFLPKEDEPRA